MDDDLLVRGEEVEDSVEDGEVEDGDLRVARGVEDHDEVGRDEVACGEAGHGVEVEGDR